MRSEPLSNFWPSSVHRPLKIFFSWWCYMNCTAKHIDSKFSEFSVCWALWSNLKISIVMDYKLTTQNFVISSVIGYVIWFFFFSFACISLTFNYCAGSCGVLFLRMVHCGPLRFSHVFDQLQSNNKRRCKFIVSTYMFLYRSEMIKIRVFFSVILRAVTGA